MLSTESTFLKLTKMKNAIAHGALDLWWSLIMTEDARLKSAATKLKFCSDILIRRRRHPNSLWLLIVITPNFATRRHLNEIQSWTVTLRRRHLGPILDIVVDLWLDTFENVLIHAIRVCAPCTSVFVVINLPGAHSMTKGTRKELSHECSGRILIISQS